MDRPYTIRAVEAKTGLSQHTIRAWERRYGVLEPDRTATNRRRYGEADVERLKLLRAAVESGHTISSVAQMTVDQLRELAFPKAVKGDSFLRAESSSTFLAAGKEAVEAYDGDRLLATLERGAAVLGLDSLLSGVVAPLVQWIGESWHEGSLVIAQEHMATAVFRSFLDRARVSLPVSAGAATVVVATPMGQWHELGAQIVAAKLALSGYRVVYLGANLPVIEIARAAAASRAKAICLSVVFPDKDPLVSSEIERLAETVGRGVTMVVGGRAAASYDAVIERAGAYRANDMSELERIMALN